MLSIQQLNEANQQTFVNILGDIFEHSRWIAEEAVQYRPFHSLTNLHQTMKMIVEKSTPEAKLTLIKAHPNLGDTVQMSDDSVSEQSNAGLKNLSPQEFQQFINLNKQYMTKYQFPFVTAVRGKNKDTIYQEMVSRIHNDPNTEYNTALNEIYKIAMFRLEEKIK